MIVGDFAIAQWLFFRSIMSASASSNSESQGQPAKVKLSDAEWKARLNDKQYRILRHKDTEFPGTGEYNKHFEPGVYKCAGCGTELYE